MARQQNNKVMICWAIISSGANYGRGIGKIVNRRATYIGASATTQTFLRTVKPSGDSMLQNVAKCLSKVDKTVWTLDNNQIGHPLKYQRYGSSNNFVKVTGRTNMKCNRCIVNIGDENEKRVPISYVDQLIVNSVKFPVFEKEVPDITNVHLVLKCLLRQNKYDGVSVKIDMTGDRVHIYQNIISIANTITQTISLLLIGYNKTTDKYKGMEAATFCISQRY